MVVHFSYYDRTHSFTLLYVRMFYVYIIFVVVRFLYDVCLEKRAIKYQTFKRNQRRQIIL